MPKAVITADIDVTPALLMGVITDFARYPEFIGDMEESVILRRDADEWTVRFVLRVIRRLEYTLTLVRHSDLHLTWALVEGVFKANTGAWRLEPLDDGARTRATYELELDLGMFVPGSVMKTLVERNLPAMMAAFKARAESLPR